jgi:superfamily II DNA/RNA helicase
MTPTLEPPRATPAPTTFSRLHVPPALTAVLDQQGFTTPTPIQTAALPQALEGRDILGQGKTGSGKTIAFAIPTVAAVAASKVGRRPGHPRGLVLVPTRELAVQVAAVFQPLARAMSLKCTTIFGGVSQTKQVNALRAGVDIVIACPGRLEDLIKQGQCSLDRVVVTVLDEADHLADLGFLPVVRRLLEQTPRQAQRLLFSATLDQAIEALVVRFLRDPAIHRVEPEPTTESSVVHRFLVVEQGDKLAVVRELIHGSERTLLFARTKHGARKLARQLTTGGVPAAELHGNLAQPARQRNLDAFASGAARVLVATDIAARGIHVDGIDLVVHVEPPAEHKAWVHRSGRTARAGADGVVVTMMTPDQTKDVQKLTRQAGITATPVAVAPGHALLRDLTAAVPEARSDEPRSDRHRPNRARSNEPRSSQPRTSQPRPTQVRSDQPRADEARRPRQRRRRRSAPRP